MLTMKTLAIGGIPYEVDFCESPSKYNIEHKEKIELVKRMLFYRIQLLSCSGFSLAKGDCAMCLAFCFPSTFTGVSEPFKTLHHTSSFQDENMLLESAIWRNSICMV